MLFYVTPMFFCDFSTASMLFPHCINDILAVVFNKYDKFLFFLILLFFSFTSIGAKRLNLCCVQHFTPEAKTKERSVVSTELYVLHNNYSSLIIVHIFM